MDDILDFQASLENHGYQQGLDTFYERAQRQRSKGRGGETEAAKRVIPLMVQEVSGSLYEMLGAKRAGGRAPVWQNYREFINTDELAVLSLFTAFSAVGGRWGMTRFLKAFGLNVRDTILSGILKSDEATEKLLARISARGKSARTRRRHAEELAVRFEKELGEWDTETLVRAGSLALSAVMSTEVFEFYEEKSKNSQHRFLGFSEMGQQLHDEAEDLVAMARPRMLPMVVPPTPWTGRRGGAYLTEELRRTTNLVRTFDREHNSLIDDAIRRGQMDRLLNTLNRVQSVPIYYDKQMIEVVEWAAASDLRISGFPVQPAIPVPELPDNFDDLEGYQKGKFLGQRRRVEAVNRSAEAAAVLFHSYLDVVSQLSDFPEVYQPHNFDYRERLYPMSAINHQGADWLKACHRFTEGKPLGMQGKRWLAIHLANCGDFEKVSKKAMDARIRWVDDNQARILQVARDWREDHWWLEADQPFSFLAACWEWAKVVERGVDHVCHLPVFIDGSNSGVQHLSAMARAEEGKLVNLSDTSEPQDVYQAVADRVVERLKEIAEFTIELPSDEEVFTARYEEGTGRENMQRWLARMWLAFGVSRKTVKRNVMTFGYSSEAVGMADQLRADVIQPVQLQYLAGQRDSFPFGPDEGGPAASFLAKINYAEIVKLLPKVHESMKFFQSCASALAHEAKGVVWETPMGFPVLHIQRVWNTKDVNCFVLDRTVPVKDADPAKGLYAREGGVYQRLRASVRTTPKQEVNKHKQSSGIAPHLVHSMDGCHLMMAAERCFNDGVNSLLMIHDSWGSLPTDMPVVLRSVRDTFVELYEEHCPFDIVRKATVARLDNPDVGLEKLKPVPIPGTLDLEETRRAQYAFA